VKTARGQGKDGVSGVGAGEARFTSKPKKACRFETRNQRQSKHRGSGQINAGVRHQGWMGIASRSAFRKGPVRWTEGEVRENREDGDGDRQEEEGMAGNKEVGRVNYQNILKEEKFRGGGIEAWPAMKVVGKKGD